MKITLLCTFEIDAEQAGTTLHSNLARKIKEFIREELAYCQDYISLEKVEVAG